MRSIRCWAAAVLSCLTGVAQATAILVPAYFYPSFDPAQSQWDEMTAAAASGAQITAIMNPDNGPGASPNSDYAAAVTAFRAAGGKVLGYVYTCYGRDLCTTGLPPTRSSAQVLADAQRYADWYQVDGIFLDEMSDRLSELTFYGEVAVGLRAAQPQWQIVGNPGTAVPVDYLAVADTIVTFERGTGSYAGAASEPWMLTEDPLRQAHLHYNVDSEAAMRLLLAQARERRAGYVYITDDRYTPGDPAEPNPWDRLPGYWDALVAATQAVPLPATAWLVLPVVALLIRPRRCGSGCNRHATGAAASKW